MIWVSVFPHSCAMIGIYDGVHLADHLLETLGTLLSMIQQPNLNEP